jgi:hypothetical protein
VIDGHILRQSNGTFIKGCIANPSGHNGHLRGWQPYGDRARYLMDKLTTREFFDMASSQCWQERFSSYDAIIINHIIAALREGGGERESLLDRIEGKPKTARP